VPVEDQDGHRVVALEVVYDGEGTWPKRAYYCPAYRLVREVLDPKHVLSVKPYAG